MPTLVDDLRALLSEQEELVELRDKIREKVREMDVQGKEMQSFAQQVHTHPGDFSQLPMESFTTATAEFRRFLKELSCMVPEQEYFRYNDLWRSVLQQALASAALIHFCTRRNVMTLQDVETMFGMPVAMDNRFHIDLDDYLQSLCLMAQELSRLAVNRVVTGDYNMPMNIAQVLRELFGAFKLLNLKNDNLRRKFDGLKYDLKKVEEVIYDLTIRGLLTTEQSAS
eukprot:Clim_evm16s183 gene=Clim_evmTU16s183